MAGKLYIGISHKTVPVTITGTGDSSYRYVTIDGTQYTAAASGIEVEPGDSITFAISKQSSSGAHVIISGQTVLTASSQTLQTYVWTVPEGITAISIAMTAPNPQTAATITVTTTEGTNTNYTAAVARQGKAIYMGVGGVARKAKSGYIGVGGVARQFWSGSEPISVTITGTGNSSTCYARINGTQYTAAASGIEVEPGDEITFAVADSQLGQSGSVIISGETVFTASSGTQAYVWTVPEGIASIRIALTDRSMMSGANITVTTGNTSGAIPVTITGTGHSSRCYVTIGGTQYTAAASGIEVLAGDSISYGISGTNTYARQGEFTVNGATIARTSSSQSSRIGTWTVPEGTNTISITLEYVTYTSGTTTTTTSYWGAVAITT